VIDTSKISSVVQVPSTTNVTLTTIATFTPQQQQLIQQAQSLQHQVVVVPGQGHQRVQQAIPINVGTLVAGSNNLVSSGIPFVVPSKKYFSYRLCYSSSDLRLATFFSAYN